ncbi:hypothetical protein SLS53_002635 [Cytospora paraplurivora]|uniref:DUF676 domain-containing protein n=1 Tax=Cytospora paraplurivora TaxID=2898453 RepID=A0AAN9UDI5_9PEZI
MKGTINKKISRFDITAVYTHPDAKVDIVLVHGLNGEPQKTWTAKTKNGGVFWPADLLPKSLEEGNSYANVLVYGYNADVSSKRHGTGPSTNYIHQHAQTLVTFLATYRKSKKTTRHPIIWVAHSLGGILLKRALEYSDGVRVADHEDYRSIYVATYGIIFLGTPHDGSELASWGSTLQGMAGHIPRKFFDSEPILIETLRKDNETLDNINMNFLNIYQRFKIHMVHENQKTDLKGTKSLIVDAKSAAPRLPGVTSYGIEADHSGMCKFESIDAPGYRLVSSAIVEWAQEAPDFISVRWNVEDEDRRVRAQLEINERARPFLTAPGGSAQIAGGIFWLRATSIQELDGEFWRVARTAAIRELVDDMDDHELRDHSKIVDIVRRWFNGLEGWLMVLDGIMFDTPGVERFVPDAVNSSLILTSTDPAASGDHHFNNPQLLHLPLLAVDEAQELLLLETEKRKPWSQEDQRQATELVQVLGRLPLMIHVTAQHLKASQEPLATFLKRYRNKPKVGKVPAYDYVLEQLHARGATAAINVMSILVFFDQDIPVEMMAMGLRALGRELPYKTRNAAAHGRPSLSNTLRVLIAFALVDRTESQDVSPVSSQSSKRSLDLPSESLDSLRTHNIIQRYFIEWLVGKKQHAFWLERAVQVFFRSYSEADRRIKENPKVGLPDDYRRFYVHGKRLVEHLVKYERRHTVLQSLKGDLERKLEDIHAEVHRFSERMQTMIVDQSSDMPQASIFDRANSLSESDSATSGSQSQSQQDSWTHLDDDDPRLFHSPTAFEPGMIYDGYGLPIPYPDTTTIPGPSFQEDDGATATPDVTPKLGSNTMAVENSPDNPRNSWTSIVSKHSKPQRARNESLMNRNRHVKGQAQVGISHEIAKPPFFQASSPRSGSSRSPSSGRLSAQSEAELALTKLRKMSPPPPRGGGVIQDKGRSLSSSMTTRPKDIMSPGEYNYARVASGLTPTDEMSQAEFYRDYGSSMPTTETSYMTATLKKFKENIAPSGITKSPSTGSSTSRAVPAAPESVCNSSGPERPVMAEMPPFPMVAGSKTAGSRTARSSPGQITLPFYPPGLPVTYDTGLTGPGHRQALVFGQGQDPAVTNSPYPPRPTSWVPHPDDAASATTTPMSRDSSAQSSSSTSNHSRQQRSLMLPPPPPPPRGRGRRHSSPLSSSPVSSSAIINNSNSNNSNNNKNPSSTSPPSRLPNIPAGGGRPPSVVTEPSPRLRPQKQPSAPEDNLVSVPQIPPLSRARAASTSSVSGVAGAAVLPLSPQQKQQGQQQGQQHPARPPARPRWYRRASGRLSRSTTDNGRARAQSQSPAAAPRFSHTSLYSNSSGGGGGGSGGGSPLLRGAASSSYAATISGGEAMARSGSGGIVVGGGRMVGFGEVSPRVGGGGGGSSDAVATQQQQQRLRDRQDIRRVVVTPTSGGGSSGSPVGLGIMREMME